MNWDFFATLYSSIASPLDSSVSVVITALTNYLTPILRALIVVYVGGTALTMMMNPTQEPLTSFLRNLVRSALVFFVISSAANFNQYFGTLFLTTLPTEIGNSISGATGAHSLTGGAFDDVWNRAWAAGLVVYKNLPWSIKGIALQFLVVAYWVTCHPRHRHWIPDLSRCSHHTWTGRRYRTAFRSLLSIPCYAPLFRWLD